jgi:hypothetical protein
VVPCRPTYDKMDTVLRNGARHSIGIRLRSSAAYTDSEAGLVDTASRAAGARLRLQQSLLHHPHKRGDSGDWPIACNVLDALLNEAMNEWVAVGHNRRHWHLDSWTLRTAEVLHPLQETLLPTMPTRTWQIPPAASTAARALARAKYIKASCRLPNVVASVLAKTGALDVEDEWDFGVSDTDAGSTDSTHTWHSQMTARDTRDDEVNTVTTDMCARPALDSEARHYHDIHFMSHRTAAESDALPKRSAVSLRGPGCSGSMVAHCTLLPDVTEIVSNARGGTLTLTTYPFRFPYSTVLHGRHRDAGGYDDTGPNAAQLAHADIRTCRHCSSSVSVDLWHYLHECTGVASKATAHRIINKVRPFLIKLADALVLAHEVAAKSAGATRPTLTEWAKRTMRRLKQVQQAAEAVTRELADMQTRGATVVDDIRGQWMTYLLVLAMPYRECDEGIQHPMFRLPRLVGRLFDASMLSNAELHPVANLWVQWASWRLKELAILTRSAQGMADAVRQRQRMAARGGAGLQVE